MSLAAIYFSTLAGSQVIATPYDPDAAMPTYSVEVVRDGEVVEFVEAVFGRPALDLLASRRGWRFRAFQEVRS